MALNMRVIAGLLVMVMTAGLAKADDRWVLRQGDFSSRDVSLIQITADSVRVIENQIEARLPIAQVVSLSRGAAKLEPAGNWCLWLIGGDRLPGEPVSWQDEKLHWKSPSLGEIVLPVRRVRGMLPIKAEVADELPTHPEDLALLANGDRAAGVITRLDSAFITLQVAGGPVEIPLASVRSIEFATLGDASGASEATFQIRTTDGGQLGVSKLSLNSTSVSFMVPDGPQKIVETRSVLSIEQLRGPVRWLSSLKPIENTTVPWFNTPFHARMNHNTSGGAILFGDRTFSHGIGVHSKSRLTWGIPDGMTSFRTQYAIDGDRPLADVTVRILAGARVLYEAATVRAGKLSEPIRLDLTGEKTLTLEVDYGDGMDVQDHLNWIEPAFIRNAD